MSDQLDIPARLLALAGEPAPCSSSAWASVGDVMRDAVTEIARLRAALRRMSATHAGGYQPIGTTSPVQPPPCKP